MKYRVILSKGVDVEGKHFPHGAIIDTADFGEGADAAEEQLFALAEPDEAADRTNHVEVVEE